MTIQEQTSPILQVRYSEQAEAKNLNWGDWLEIAEAGLETELDKNIVILRDSFLKQQTPLEGMIRVFIHNLEKYLTFKQIATFRTQLRMLFLNGESSIASAQIILSAIYKIESTKFRKNIILLIIFAFLIFYFIFMIAGAK